MVVTNLVYDIVLPLKLFRAEADLLEYVKSLIYECADMQRWHILECAVSKEEVYLRVKLGPTWALDKVVYTLKRGVDQAVSKKYSYDGSVWGGGCDVRTVGKLNREAVNAYVAMMNQKGELQ